MTDRFRTVTDWDGNPVCVQYASVAKSVSSYDFTAAHTDASYTYDSRKRLSQYEDKRANITHTYTYDALDRPTSHRIGSHLLSTQYSPYGETVKSSWKFNDSATDTLVYDYVYGTDSKRTLASMTVGAFEERYAQDVLGRSVANTRTLGGKTYAERYGYYKRGDRATSRVNTISYAKDGLTGDKLTYTYDSLGNIVSVNLNGRQTTKYAYDKIGRLSTEKHLDTGVETVYTYDNVGNILSKSVTGGAAGNGEKAYTYADGTDRLVRFGDETIVYDNLGNPTTYRGQTLVWERARQLKRVTDSDGQTIDYAYDASGLRLSKTLGGIQTSFVYADGQLIRQTKSGETIDFIYGAGGIIGLTIRTGSQTKHYLFRKNLFGDVTHIYDESGATVGTYDYTAFGTCTVVTDVGGIATLNPIRYRSYYYDTETQRYYLKSRYYDPETGRFINLDDLSYLDPDTINGLNLYAYCGNNPVMYTDSTGCAPQWMGTWWGKALGWLATAALVVGAVAMIALVAVGTVASGGLLAAVLVGAGVGILAGVGGSVITQLATTGNVNPWSVAISGAIGGVVGAFSGAASFGLAQIGQALGQSIGFALSNAKLLGAGVKIAKTLGITTSMLMKAGMVVGGFAGGAAGGFAANYAANSFVANAFGPEYMVDNPNYVRSGLLKFFQWLNPLA